VVVAIIAVLASLLLPSLSKARTLAFATECMGRHRQLGLAAGVYAADYPPFVPVQHTGPEELMWARLLLPYVSGELRVFSCPRSRFQWDGGTFGNRGSIGTVYQNPYNYYAYRPWDGLWLPANNVWWVAWPVTPGTGWREPALSIYLADAACCNTPRSYPTVEWIGTTHIHVPTRGNYDTGSGGSRRFADRHNGCNTLFVDGHAKRYQSAVLDMMRPAGADGNVWDVY
jgi:prepilin-type processing-associated H-X9-DG protein